MLLSSLLPPDQGRCLGVTLRCAHVNVCAAAGLLAWPSASCTESLHACWSISLSLPLSLSCPGRSATARPLSVRPSNWRTAGLLHSRQDPQQVEHHSHVPTLLLDPQHPAPACSRVFPVVMHTRAAGRAGSDRCTERTRACCSNCFNSVCVCGVCVHEQKACMHMSGVSVRLECCWQGRSVIAGQPVQRRRAVLCCARSAGI